MRAKGRRHRESRPWLKNGLKLLHDVSVGHVPRKSDLYRDNKTPTIGIVNTLRANPLPCGLWNLNITVLIFAEVDWPCLAHIERYARVNRFRFLSFRRRGIFRPWPLFAL